MFVRVSVHAGSDLLVFMIFLKQESCPLGPAFVPYIQGYDEVRQTTARLNVKAPC